MAAPILVLCETSTYLMPFSSTPSSRMRPTVVAMPPCVSRSSRGCGRNGSSSTSIHRGGAAAASRATSAPFHSRIAARDLLRRTPSSSARRTRVSVWPSSTATRVQVQETCIGVRLDRGRLAQRAEDLLRLHLDLALLLGDVGDRRCRGCRGRSRRASGPRRTSPAARSSAPPARRSAASSGRERDGQPGGGAVGDGRDEALASRGASAARAIERRVVARSPAG